MVQRRLAMFDKKDELRDRVNARKHELMSKLDDLKADTRHDAASTRDRLKKELDDLEVHIKDGWDKLTDGARAKLNSWLSRKDTDTKAKEPDSGR
jgi:hypothetical protein